MLMVLDGWGHRDDPECNATLPANTPVLSQLMQDYPHTLIETAGLAVGLPPGQMGNSEVGHQNLGAGRVVYQDFTRISRAIEQGDFFENPMLTQACDTVRARGTALHLMGLLSDGGVHSHMDHLSALLELTKRKGLRDVWVHAILDGRDTPPTSGVKYVERLQACQAKIGTGGIASVMGRFYAMDRDNRWERVQEAYQTMVGGGTSQPSAREAVLASYQQDVTDEFVRPVSIAPDGARPVTVRPGDAIIFYNFRADRARQITRAFTQERFSGFAREKLDLSAFICMTEYDETFSLPIAFPPMTLTDIFPEVISRLGLKQLRIAETEKYAHVTFFFNGGEERKYPGEERILIPSPRDVTTYDQKPEMSAVAVTDEVIRQIKRDYFDVIILNFANGDMVGHTGALEAAIRAVKTVDGCIGRIHEAIDQQGGTVLITADHGNCEMMCEPGGDEPYTAHTTNPVPLILTRKGARLREGGILADVSPTLLDLLNITKPEAMTGKSLLI